MSGVGDPAGTSCRAMSRSSSNRLMGIWDSIKEATAIFTCTNPGVFTLHLTVAASVEITQLNCMC